MKQAVQVGIIGDFDTGRRSHIATNEAIHHAADGLGIAADVGWLSTVSLEVQPTSTLELFDALWCSPGSPYASMEGALRAIRFARERDVPFIGT
jgi:CTP synthase (UTP-ammonia lyase)